MDFNGWLNVTGSWGFCKQLQGKSCGLRYCLMHVSLLDIWSFLIVLFAPTFVCTVFKFLFLNVYKGHRVE